MGRRAGLPKLYFPTGDTKVWWCRFTVDGNRYRLSTGHRDHAAATAEAQRLHGLAQLGRLAANERRRKYHPTTAGALTLTVAQFIVWMRANGKAQSYVVKVEQHFRAHFLKRWSRLDDITSKAIEHYKVSRAEDDPPPRLTTLYKELVSLSRFLRWCKKFGHLDEVPEFERFKPVTDYEPPNLTPDDVSAVLAELPTQRTHQNRYPVREFYTVQWAQGMRPGEVCKLRWSHVDLVQRRITIPALNDKAREGRTIGMTTEAYRVLRQLAKEPHLPTSFIFGNRSFRRSLDMAVARAKVKRFTPHGLRHARLSELASNTRDTAALQFFAGHKNLSTTERYVRSRTERTELMLRELDSGKVRAKGLDKGGKRKRSKVG